MFFALTCLLTITLAGFAYCVVGPKFHVKPWLLLLAGFVAIVLLAAVTWWSDLNPDISKNSTRNIELLLLGTTLGALSGGFIGAAISNKALFAHQHALSDLNRQAILLDEEMLLLKNELEKAKNLSTNNAKDILDRSNKIVDLLVRYESRLQQLLKKQHDLSP